MKALSRTMLAALATAAIAVTGAAADTDEARAALELTEFSGLVVDEDGDPATQAGAHPYSATTTFRFATVPQGISQVPGGSMKDIRVDLPPGFVGNPSATPTKCTSAQLTTYELTPNGFYTLCPASSQVGTVTIHMSPPFFPAQRTYGVYNMEPLPGHPAQFGFMVDTGGLQTPIVLKASVRPNDYGVRVDATNTPQPIAIHAVSMTFWGVPADASHDPYRGRCLLNDGTSGGLCPADGAQIPFLTNPADCSAGPLTTTLRVNSWQMPGTYLEGSFDEDVNGVPMEVENCEPLPFDPSFEARPTVTQPDSPTGLAVDLRFPQQGLHNGAGLATAPLRDAVVTLPEGMTINPAGADGLAACSDAQMGFGTDAPVACPEAARIGTVRAVTPLLEEPLDGGVYIRSQVSSDPESGEMFRLALVLENEERGLRIKLPGQVRVDAETGRVQTTFARNPQLPVDRISLELKSGPRAPLATPTTCGEKTVDATLTSWGGQVARLRSTFSIACVGGGFAPSFSGGSVNPVGGAFSPFAVRIARDDREQFLSGVEVDLPEGLLANLRGVPLCSDAAATNGGCPAGSKIGTATVGAGPGASPFYLSGDVFLTEGYRGGPYGLAVHVHAKAGPFDLGWVRVRQALYVDPETAEVSVVSDPLPQIVKGVPVRLRDVRVDVDRSEFMVNPTSCSEKRVDATLTSARGAVHRTSSRFRVAGCAALPFRPRMRMRLFGPKQRRTGGHPALRAVLRQTDDQANVDRARVLLPKSIALDAENSNDPELLCDYDAAQRGDCPESSVIGRARAVTPVLNHPLSGPVHLVQGIRIAKGTGNRVRTTPHLLVKLSGEVQINLRAKTTAKRGYLITRFLGVPDAPVKRFAMRIKGGKKGILTVTRTRRSRINLCDKRQIARVQLKGQNGRNANFRARVRTPCGKKARRGAKAKARRKAAATRSAARRDR